MPKTVKRKTKLNRYRKRKTKKHAGGGKKKEAATAAAKAARRARFNTPISDPPPPFRILPNGECLLIEIYATDDFPDEFPDSERIQTISFGIGSYTTPLEDNNILSRINFSSLQNLTNVNFTAIDVITGTLPTSMFTLPRIQNIYIMNNKQLTGVIPNLPMSLEVLVLSNNGLTGPIPQLLGTNLIELNLCNNQLTGNIPELPGTLETLELFGNMLDGGLPLLPDGLNTINVSDNRLSGLLPELLPGHLSSFGVANNRFSGAIPNFLNHRLRSFRISGNNFFEGENTDPELSIRNLLTMAQSGFIHFSHDIAFYFPFEIPLPILYEDDETKLNYLLEQFEASADPLMG